MDRPEVKKQLLDLEAEEETIYKTIQRELQRVEKEIHATYREQYASIYARRKVLQGKCTHPRVERELIPEKEACLDCKAIWEKVDELSGT